MHFSKDTAQSLLSQNCGNLSAMFFARVEAQDTFPKYQQNVVRAIDVLHFVRCCYLVFTFVQSFFVLGQIIFEILLFYIFYLLSQFCVHKIVSENLKLVPCFFLYFLGNILLRILNVQLS